MTATTVDAREVRLVDGDDAQTPEKLEGVGLPRLFWFALAVVLANVVVLAGMHLLPVSASADPLAANPSYASVESVHAQDRPSPFGRIIGKSTTQSVVRTMASR